MVTYFRYRRCENNNFVQLADSLHESVHAGAFDHVDIVILAFNLHRNSKISLMENLSDSQHKQANRGTRRELTLKLLCTNVSSKSRTRHFFPLNRG